MASRLFTVLILLACWGCQPARPTLEGLPESASRAAYFTNPVVYQKDSIAGRLDDGFTSGIVMNISLGGQLNHPISGSRNLETVTDILNEHPEWFPVLCTYFGQSVFEGFCEGKRLEDIQKLADWFMALDRPAGITVGYQVNSPMWELPPKVVVEGMRCFIESLRTKGAEKVAIGWHLSSMYPGYRDSDLLDYYPGPDYVDFIATDLARFTDQHFLTQNDQFSRSNLPRLTEVAQDLKMPIIIVDANPTAAYRLLPSSADGVYEEFYAPLDSLLRQNRNVAAYTVYPGDIPDSLSLPYFLTTHPSQTNAGR